MPALVLLLQPDPVSAKTLNDYFTRRGDQTLQANDLGEAYPLLSKKPNLLLMDLHLPGDQWVDFLSYVRQNCSQTQVIMTNKTPDVRRELLAKDCGVKVFLRQPFTPRWIGQALQRLAGEAEIARSTPGVRVPMRLKITFPYALLAVMFALASFFVISRYILETIRERFVNGLVNTAVMADDWMVQEEDRTLETLRLLANTQGMADAILAGDAESLRRLALPVAVNYQEQAVVILDRSGSSLLALYHKPGGGLAEYDALGGEADYAAYPFVKKVLALQSDPLGDKFAGLALDHDRSHGGYFFIAGPVLDAEGKLVGVVIVGKTLETLVQEMRTDILAHVTLYAPDGLLLATTLLLPEQVVPVAAEAAGQVQQKQDRQSDIRPQTVGSIQYSEILGMWEARHREDLGLMGVAMAENLLVQPSLITRLQAFLVVTLAVAGIVILGIILAGQITRPLGKMVRASGEVARGNFEVKVPPEGDDEVAVLASAFNRMVIGLQEGFIYRDLLGRTVSPQVREALRQSFATGELRLEGQSAVATVMMSDIRDFTRLSETEKPTTVLQWLNEYFGEMVPEVTLHSGVVDKFEGDAMLAFFGILPVLLPPHESALKACQSAVRLLEVIEKINQRRASRNEPPLRTGIGIHTGPVTAGGLGTADRLNYTVIGDTVNTTQRLQDISRECDQPAEPNASSAVCVVSQNVVAALQGRRGDFHFESLGERAFKGKQERLWVYRLLPGPGRWAESASRPEQGRSL